MNAVRTLLLTLVLALLPQSVPAAVADDHAELERLLHTFLAAADARAIHESFWADDLIYTASSGERFGKAEILAGFDGTGDDDPYPPSYGAEDVTVRVMDDVAVVTFRLTADQDGQRIAEYFNTGVFRRAGDSWAAFTWQATRIPADD
ncbi:nuclear transport factor 2 family protein [Wenzhouxiangella sp. XN79A]|uniref:nuclear transport factor 2 family protein n=1 Tax=Wenzhouxiangella sp. XN79A TaxID=2724193 RepID=UPI00144AF9D3|nr:nuclear transport factor 2 family protein [Wenzhouxiangella sp. XN79A]NKI36136.1 nuclear transport factor 2 family protein [Wenzhouxiangella sp. XN79A]